MLRYHTNTGSISLDFVANDDCEYIIVKTIRSKGNNPVKIIQKETKEDENFWDKGDWYDKEEKDSIRNSWGLADNGKPFPIDIYDQYMYRNGKLKKQYSLKDILGTWYGYGHLYDDRKTLILKEDGSYELIREEALNQDENGKMIYDYYSTISGKYFYDTKENKITLLN